MDNENTSFAHTSSFIYAAMAKTTMASIGNDKNGSSSSSGGISSDDGKVTSLVKENAFNTGWTKGCCIEDVNLCCYTIACTSCAVGKLSLRHEPGTFCCSGNYYDACSFYMCLTLLPAVAAAYVLGPAIAIFFLPTVGGIFRFMYGCNIRAGIRKKYKIKSNCCCDFLHAYLLEPCTIYQEIRETELREEQHKTISLVV